MNILILSPGSFGSQSIEKDLYEHYARRITGKLELIELRHRYQSSPELIKEKEAEWIISKTPPKAYVITLDIQGSMMTSPSLAQTIKDIPLLCFIIGGAYGLSPKIKGHTSLSLGSLTYPHLLVRCILAEQIYRCQSILKSHPYHKE